MIEHDIGKIIRESYKEIYKSKPGRSISAFSGGNVGMIFLGLQIEKAANRLAEAIENHDTGNDSHTSGAGTVAKRDD